MDASELYDHDFVAWTEQQAAALRAMGSTSNSLDVPNLAEEIESFGRRDLREVESLIRQILLDLLKIAADPGSGACPHGRLEIARFQVDASRAFSPSMAQKIDVDHIWQHTARAFLTEFQPGRTAGDARCPIVLGELMAAEFDIAGMVARVAPAVRPAGAPG